MPSSRPTTPATPASPKTFKIKDPQPGVPLFGCEHTQLLLSAGGAERMNKSIHNYKTCLRPRRQREEGSNMAERRHIDFMCDDFVFDPTLEDLRLRKSGKGLTRKRKLDDLFTDPIKEDPRFISTNTVEAPCRASGIRAYEELASNKEQDAHEFFQFLTEELHEINGGGRPSDSEDSPVKKSKSDSDPDCKCIVHQTFYGKLQSTITCQSCGDINTSIESFLDLSLGLDVLSKKKSLKATALSLQKCLDEEYSRPERCEYSCRKCNTQEAKKQLSIKSLPNVLCIQLKDIHLA
ncbi:putative Ubiquitin carboxyl-terminal hydrolase 8 [Glarea lozoyensis 74030]|uniref:Putative Ubiquitin carboxyl-terminal hydrolase 8 n=1 Tax=Glarea lozoyensis (strain ATCC 74030 / MF5533) TaxID=1104152 RepID=H0EL99_GLAL7|nr:putative Ubiquitin carboxyl-terminal hydrolase 8 [Glarea lozoyensis 74030]